MKDKKAELFTHRDFYHLSKGLCRSIANDANEILNKKLAECPRVYGSLESGDWDLDIKKGVHPTYTHTALLFDVQPIVEESKCEHKPEVRITVAGVSCVSKCVSCGIELKATKWDVHCVHKEDYDQLQKEVEALKVELDKQKEFRLAMRKVYDEDAELLKECREVIEFYGNEENYQYGNELQGDDEPNDENREGFVRTKSGKRARAMLKKLEVSE